MALRDPVHNYSMMLLAAGSNAEQDSTVWLRDKVWVAESRHDEAGAVIYWRVIDLNVLGVVFVVVLSGSYPVCWGSGAGQEWLGCCGKVCPFALKRHECWSVWWSRAWCLGRMTEECLVNSWKDVQGLMQGGGNASSRLGSHR